MSRNRGAVAALPAAVAWLCLALTPALAQRPGSPPVLEGPILTRTDVVPTFQFCPGNRFTNGDFSDTAFNDPDLQPHQDINLATGWLPLWDSDSGASLADLFGPSPSVFPAAVPPNPNGNFAAMWIYNGGPATGGSKEFREGMFNQLTNAIAAKSGVYQFKFKTSAVFDAQRGGPSVVAIHGVNWTNAILPNAPSGINDPPNDDLFGPANTVLLQTVVIPSTPGNAWNEHKVTFDSGKAGWPPQITHVMVTKADAADYPPGVAPAYQARYFAFDDFCMQTAEDAGLPVTPAEPVKPDCPGPKCTNTDYSTCCPPSATFPVYSQFTPVQGAVGSPYHLKFALDPAFDAQMVAYVALAKALDTNFNGLAMTIRIFSGGTGLTAAIASGSQSLEPDAGIHWWAGGGNGNQWQSAFFTSASNLPTNTWIVVEMTTWTLGPGRPWSQNCEVRRFAWRPQLDVSRGRTRAAPAFTVYTGPPPTRPPTRPQRTRPPR